MGLKYNIMVQEKESCDMFTWKNNNIYGADSINTIGMIYGKNWNNSSVDEYEVDK